MHIFLCILAGLVIETISLACMFMIGIGMAGTASENDTLKDYIKVITKEDTKHSIVENIFPTIIFLIASISFFTICLPIWSLNSLIKLFRKKK